MATFFDLVTFLSLITCSSQAVTGNDVVTQSNDTVKVFHHRGYHTSIVVGHYLYIDGGEITTWDGDGDGLQTTNLQDPGNIVTLPNNYTYSIDLSTSWINSSVILNRIEKAAPVLNSQGLWLDSSKGVFYAYDGALAASLPEWVETTPPSNALWQFEPSGNSGGWSQVTIDSSSNFSALSRVCNADYTSGNGLGFALGGMETYGTYHYSDWTDNVFGTNLVPGLIMFNSSSQEWYNISSKDYSYYGFAASGAAHFVPSFGPTGLLFVLGGYTTSVQQQFPLQTVAMFDPSTQQWQSQTTSGDVPQALADTCVVGVQSDEDTYEIFVYGGRVPGIQTNIDDTLANSGVWVLSLPSFHWQKLASTSPARYLHTCNLVGKRQMAVIGGMVFDSNVPADALYFYPSSQPDPWEQGIGILDLTDVGWRSSYNASASEYITPDIVKAYHAANGRYPSQWANPVVENWFKNPGISSNSSTPSTPNRPLAQSGSRKAGIIVAAVVGPIAGIALSITVIVILLQKRRAAIDKGQQTSVQQSSDDEMRRMESELDESCAKIEMPVKERRHEIGEECFQELNAERIYELEVPGQDRRRV